RRFPPRTYMLVGMFFAVATMAAAAVAVGSTRVSVGTRTVIIGVLWALLGAGLTAAATPIGRVVTEAVEEPQLDDAFAGQFVTSHAWWL
ncbi:hypothetical protein L1030_24625, partial [Escherichia coli]|nr:hypothetical protein [Escherichia coli]